MSIQRGTDGILSVGELQLRGGDVKLAAQRHRISDRGTGEKSTGILLPQGSVVLEVFLEVLTAETTASAKTVDVGTLSTDSGDAGGFLVAAVTSGTGVVQGLLLGTDTLGALLKEDTNGSSVNVRKNHIVGSTGRRVTYTLGSAHTELEADIVVLYLVI